MGAWEGIGVGGERREWTSRGVGHGVCVRSTWLGCVGDRGSG